jgi:hypothetical protein
MDMGSPLAGKLLPGERLVWSGQPRQGLMFQPMDAFLVPFSIVWTGIAATMFVAGGFGMATGQLHSAQLPFLFIPTLFLVFGAYFTVGRFLHDAWMRSRIHYGVTERRALILRGDSLTAIDLARTGTVRLKGGGGGRGTIDFTADDGLSMFRMNGFGMWTPSATGSRFIGIEGAQEVFNQIEAIRAKAP